MKNPQYVQSVLKALTALDYILEESMTRPGVTLSEISGALSLQPTTMRNILRTMEAAGYVGRSARLYRPGAKCFCMSRGASLSAEKVELLSRMLGRLASETGESLVFTTLFNGMRKVLLRQQGNSPIVVETRQSEQDSMSYRLVTTWIMLAFAPRREVVLFVERNGLPDGFASGGFPLLLEELDRLRARGVAEMHLERGGTYAAAFPVLDTAGMMLGALGIHMPEFRADDKKKMEIFTQLRKALQEISGRL